VVLDGCDFLFGGGCVPARGSVGTRRWLQASSGRSDSPRHELASSTLHRSRRAGGQGASCLSVSRRRSQDLVCEQPLFGPLAIDRPDASEPTITSSDLTNRHGVNGRLTTSKCVKERSKNKSRGGSKIEICPRKSAWDRTERTPKDRFLLGEIR